MTDKKFGDLDELLGSWSSVHEPSQDHLDQLTVQVDESLTAAEDKLIPVSLLTPASWNSAYKFVLSTAAAVAMVISAVLWIALHDGEVADIDKPQQIASTQASDPIEKITPGQRLQKQKLLAELDRMFAGKRVWFAETESDVVLGGDFRPSASEIAAESPVAMRLVLAKRSSSTDAWQRVWSADVVSRTDQLVQFVSREPARPTASFTAWTHLLPDGLVAYDVDLKWNDGVSCQLSDSLLLSPGDTKQGPSLSIDGVEYRLFHAVSVLDSSTS